MERQTSLELKKDCLVIEVVDLRIDFTSKLAMERLTSGASLTFLFWRGGPNPVTKCFFNKSLSQFPGETCSEAPSLRV